MTYRLIDFPMMNCPIFLRSKVREDPLKFVNSAYKVLSIMRMTSREKVELASYHLKDVPQVRYTQLKNNRPVESGLI